MYTLVLSLYPSFFSSSLKEIELGEISPMPQDDLVASAQHELASSKYNHFLRDVTVSCEGDDFVLSGRAPSPAMSQQAQEALRSFSSQHGKKIDNRITFKY